jgi:uncharacterized iron-regulated protein
MKKLLLLLLLCPMLANATDKITKKNYRIYSVRSGREVSLNEIVRDMRNYDVLFFGEEHNDSVTHFLEHRMLELLYDQYGNDVVLSMEMFERDVQPVMDEYLQGFIREKHFMKDARVWGNYRDYKPMVEFAKEKGLDVICANAAARYTNIAGRNGQKALAKLPYESKRFFAPLPYDTAQGAYYKKLTALPEHGPGTTTDVPKGKAKGKKEKEAPKMDMAAMMGNFNLVMAQSLWDATMAYSIAHYRRNHRGKKIMQVNGKFHSDEGFAVVSQLDKYSPGTRKLIISTSSDEHFPRIKWSQYQEMGDYIIITDPKVPKTYKDH